MPILRQEMFRAGAGIGEVASPAAGDTNLLSDF
jgi:hypothetical protein